MRSGDDRSFVDAPRERRSSTGPPCRNAAWRNDQVWRLQVGAGVDPEPLHLRGRHGADPVELPDRQALDEGRAHLRRDDEQAVGLALVGRHLGQELVVGDARRRGQARSRRGSCARISSAIAVAEAMAFRFSVTSR